MATSPDAHRPPMVWYTNLQKAKVRCGACVAQAAFLLHTHAAWRHGMPPHTHPMSSPSHPLTSPAAG